MLKNDNKEKDNNRLSLLFFFLIKILRSVLKTVSPRFSSCNPFSSSTERYASFWLKTHAPSFRVCSMHIHNITSSSAKAFLLISAERNARGCGRTNGPRFFAYSRHVQRISNRELLRRREKSGPNERVPTLLTFDRFISALFFFVRTFMAVTFSLFNDVGFFRSLGPTLTQQPFGSGRDDRWTDKMCS